MASEKKLTLKSYDGEIFEIEKSAAVNSRMLKNMIEDNCASDTIPVPNVDGKTLAMVVEYCKKHANKDNEEEEDGEEEDDDDSDDVDEEEEEEDGEEEEEDDDDDDDEEEEEEEEDDDESEEDEDLKSFDSEFYDKDQAVLYDLIMAANYLNIPELLGGLCRKVAEMIKGKSPDEIRKTFNIVSDLSPEEEEEIRNQNAWVFK